MSPFDLEVLRSNRCLVLKDFLESLSVFDSDIKHCSLVVFEASHTFDVLGDGLGLELAQDVPDETDTVELSFHR